MANRKDILIAEIKRLNLRIQDHADGRSLATLDHLVKQRQSAIESLMEDYRDVLSSEEMNMLMETLDNVKVLSVAMQAKRDHTGDSLVNEKKRGQKLKVYTSIARSQ